jgi:Transmembrane protein 43
MADEETGGEENRDFTETTNESYCSKMQNACTGVCIGFLLFFASIGLLIYNEGRTVKRAKDIDEGQENVILLDLNNFTNTSLPSSFENQLIYAVGDLSTTDVLTDPIFGVTNAGDSNSATGDSALKIRRAVKMYQWKQTVTTKQTKTANGGTQTTKTYSYSTVWSSTLIDSSQFKQQNPSRKNPTSLAFEPLSLEADPILLGNRILLSDSVVGMFNWYEPLDTISLDDVPDATLKSKLTLESANSFYFRKSNTTTSADPQVGDARVTFTEVPPDTISIIAKASRTNGNYSLDSYITKRGGSLLLVERGNYTSEEMFAQADAENTALAWVLRFVGFVLMVISILLILQPLATAVDIIPFVGDCMQGGMEGCIFPMIAFLIALPMTLFVISLAWLAYRPQIAIPILVVTLGLMIWLWIRAKRGKKVDEPIINESNPQDYSSTYNNDKPDYSASPYEYHTSGTTATATPVADAGFATALDTTPPPMNPAYSPTTEGDVVFK